MTIPKIVIMAYYGYTIQLITMAHIMLTDKNTKNDKKVNENKEASAFDQGP